MSLCNIIADLFGLHLNNSTSTMNVPCFGTKHLWLLSWRYLIIRLEKLSETTTNINCQDNREETCISRVKSALSRRKPLG